jgi:hydrogenase-4 component F
VVICSVGIAVAFLGTVLLYFAARHGGAGSADALDVDVLLRHATGLDERVTRLAAGLLLLGFGAKAGLVPFHTWLADAHSQAPAPVSALMSGVLLSVAFYAVLRVKPILDLAVGAGFLRAGLLSIGLLTLLVSASLLMVQTDFKRMLAYSSMENMGLVAIAAAAGTRLAVTALLLHILGHGVVKSVLFLSAGQLQAAHNSTSIAGITAVLSRSRLLGGCFAVGIVALLGLPPSALFASELSIARGLAGTDLAWALAIVLLLWTIAFGAIAVNAVRLLFGSAHPGGPAIAVPATVTTALVLGVAATVTLGITAGPLTGLFRSAAAALGVVA